MNKASSKYSFSVIKHYNSPNEAVTLDGYTVKRQEKLWMGADKGFVVCSPYDNHFVYLDPYRPKPGEPSRWGMMCTCGSPAVLVGTNAYSIYGSPQGWMVVCYYHTLNGVHQTGERPWI